ncbi:MAG: hypothetical protein IT580_07015 [Verrucomicrobiales bacterium]|nr:hypothetical protein [Verrucomicrobiales bacterium]
MIPNRCPLCGARLGQFMYADQCPHCHRELVHNRRPTEMPAAPIPPSEAAWPFRALRGLARLIES